MKKLLVPAVLVLFLAGLANAGDVGTQAEAEQLVKKAVAYVKSSGKEKAMAEFNNLNGKFNSKDLYIFAVDFQGIVLAQGGNPKLVGKDFSKMPFIQKMIELAQTKGSGWADYKWTNPTTKKVESKTSYVQRIDNYFLGCGVYK